LAPDFDQRISNWERSVALLGAGVKRSYRDDELAAELSLPGTRWGTSYCFATAQRIVFVISPVEAPPREPHPFAAEAP